jgi:hypothetical protein
MVGLAMAVAAGALTPLCAQASDLSEAAIDQCKQVLKSGRVGSSTMFRRRRYRWARCARIPRAARRRGG